MGVEVVEIDLNLKYVLLPVSLDLHFTEAQRGSFLFQSVLPSEDLLAHWAIIGSPRTVGCGSGELVLLGVFPHRAVDRFHAILPASAKPHCQLRISGMSSPCLRM